MTFVNDWKPLTNVTKSFILDVVGALDTPLSFDFKVRTKVNRENDDFIAFLLVNLLSFNLFYKQKDNKKTIFCDHFNFKVVKLRITLLY